MGLYESRRRARLKVRSPRVPARPGPAPQCGARTASSHSGLRLRSPAVAHIERMAAMLIGRPGLPRCATPSPAEGGASVARPPPPSCIVRCRLIHSIAWTVEDRCWACCVHLAHGPGLCRDLRGAAQEWLLELSTVLLDPSERLLKSG